MDARRLGKAVRRRRMSMGLSQSRFAATYGFPLSTLQAIEGARHAQPQEEKLYRLDSIFDVDYGTSIQILSGERDDYPPPPPSSVAALAHQIADLGERDVELVQLLVRRLAV